MVRIACAGLFVGMVACSRAESSVPAPVGTGSSSGGVDDVDPALVDSPADRCFAQCDADHAASAALFDAMDGCLEEKCKLAEDQAPYTKVACGPLDSKAITYNDAETDACLSVECCAQVTACANDADCAGASSCYDRCAAMR